MKLTKKIFSLILAVVIMLPVSSTFMSSGAATRSIPSDAQEYNGHWYKHFNISMLWSEARIFCENLGGHLITITTYQEQDFAFELIKNGSKSRYWIGLTDENIEGMYEWVTGEPYSHDPYYWAAGEPNDGAPGPEDYVTMYTDTGKWCDTEIDADGNYINYGLICEWEPENNISQDFIELHTNFYKNNHNAILEDGFYNVSNFDVIKKDVALGRIWDTIKDLGEVATLKFNKLQVTANYYDAFLADVLMSLMEKDSANEIKLKALSNYSKYLGSMETFLKSSKEYKDLSFDLDIKSAFDSSYDISGEMKESLERIFKDAYANNPELFRDIFQGFDCANEICKDIDAALDVYNTLVKCYNSYCTARAMKEVNEDFYVFCEDVARELEKTEPKFAGWFRKNVDRFKENASSDKDLYTAAKAAYEFGYTTYDLLIKHFAKDAVYNLVSNALGTTVGRLMAVIEAWNVGTALADMIAGNDTETLYYMYYVAPVEGAMETVLSKYGEELAKSNSYDDAQKYDIAFKTLKETNIALFNAVYKNAEKWHILWYKSQAKKDDMSNATYYKGKWQNYFCHKDDYTEVQGVTDYKTVSVRCPVDVYFYNAAGENIISIVNEEITASTDERIAVNVFNEKKSFSYPADEDYNIRIVAREYGKMDYSVYADSENTDRQIEFYDIPLVENQEFFGKIPQDILAQKRDFCLYTKDNEITVDYDSIDANICEENGHRFCDWKTIEEATCVSAGYSVRSCSVCGKQEKESIEINSENHVNKGRINIKTATCTQVGYTGDLYCYDCERILEIGNEIPKTAHSDADNDGWCNDCGAELYEHVTDPSDPSSPSDSDNVCKYCGKVHSGFWGWFVKVFHNILWFFKNLF